MANELKIRLGYFEGFSRESLEDGSLIVYAAVRRQKTIRASKIYAVNSAYFVSLGSAEISTNYAIYGLRGKNVKNRDNFFRIKFFYELNNASGAAALGVPRSGGPENFPFFTP